MVQVQITLPYFLLQISRIVSSRQGWKYTRMLPFPEKIKRSNISPSCSCLWTSLGCLSITSKCIQVCPQLSWHSHQMRFRCWHLAPWAVTLQNRHGLKEQTCCLLMLMLKDFIIFTFTFAPSLNILYIVGNLSCATAALPLPASFPICSYFVYACINNNSASAMQSICLRRFSLPDRQTAQTSFVSSQEQKLYYG